MKIQIQLSANNKIMGKLIKWFTRGEFDHTDIVLKDGELLGAHLFGGIKKTVFKESNFSKIKRYEIEVSEPTYRWAVAQQGRKYDLWAIIAFMIKIPVRETTSSICSEFSFDVLKKSEALKGNVYFQSSKISPRDLHLVLQILESSESVKLL